MKNLAVSNTLESFGSSEIDTLVELLDAYNHAGQFHGGKKHAALPETWSNDGVYFDFNPHSGAVFLTNADYDVLVATDYGVGKCYTMPYAMHSGNLFELAEFVIDELSASDGTITPISACSWHTDDLNYAYQMLVADTPAFIATEADITPLLRARELIIKSFVLEKLGDSFVDTRVSFVLEYFDFGAGDFSDCDQLAEFICDTLLNPADSLNANIC